MTNRNETNKQANKQKQEQNKTEKKHPRLADRDRTTVFSIKIPNLLNTILIKSTTQVTLLYFSLHPIYCKKKIVFSQIKAKAF